MTTTTDASGNGTCGSAAATETTEIYRVVGMTCDHCARAVTSELVGIAGVSEVSVDVPTGEVTVCSAQPLADSDVRAAIDEAGYQLA